MGQEPLISSTLLCNEVTAALAFGHPPLTAEMLG